MKLLNSIVVAMFCIALVSCDHFRGTTVQIPQVTVSDYTWSCTGLTSLPSDSELITLSSYQLFKLYKDEWLGHEDCYKTLILNKEKLETDLAARAKLAAEKK